MDPWRATTVTMPIVVFGLVATPFFYAGWGLIAAAVVLALVVRSTPRAV